MGLESEIREIVGSVLGLGTRTANLSAETPMLGEIPELDSMAVVALITAIEDQYGLTVDDDEVSAETFETFGALCRFVGSKLDEA
jgi:acyl carrier protein